MTPSPVTEENKAATNQNKKNWRKEATRWAGEYLAINVQGCRSEENNDNTVAAT